MNLPDVPSGLTVTEAIAELRADGYAEDVSVQDDGLRCSRCRHVHRVDEVVIGAALRVEGATDPGDEAIVLGLVCSSCRARAVLVAGYGPTADPVEAGVVARLADRRT
ncbi:MAG: hypothetical protein JJE52_13965 [Acidimicrobiia bacterium]|nr:hypothetical protein [Acidimicrobiia bacterium]